MDSERSELDDLPPMPELPRQGRAERRAQLRRARREYGAVLARQSELDSAMIVAKKAQLRRRYGNPVVRLGQFRRWIAAENSKRGYVE